MSLSVIYYAQTAYEKKSIYNKHIYSNLAVIST